MSSSPSSPVLICSINLFEGTMIWTILGMTLTGKQPHEGAMVGLFNSFSMWIKRMSTADTKVLFDVCIRRVALSCQISCGDIVIVRIRDYHMTGSRFGEDSAIPSHTSSLSTPFRIVLGELFLH